MHRRWIQNEIQPGNDMIGFRFLRIYCAHMVLFDVQASGFAQPAFTRVQCSPSPDFLSIIQSFGGDHSLTLAIDKAEGPSTYTKICRLLKRASLCINVVHPRWRHRPGVEAMFSWSHVLSSHLRFTETARSLTLPCCRCRNNLENVVVG